MKLFVAVFCALAGLAAAGSTDIDWSSVRPLYVYKEWQDTHPGHMRLLREMNAFEKLEKMRFGPTGLIVGGTEATPHQFPYQVGLILNLAEGSGWCGGSLVSANYILTAAHCIDTPASMVVLLGAHNIVAASEPNQQRIHVDSSNFKIYPNWDAQLIRNDIAVARLTQSANYGQFIRSVRLPNWGQTGLTFAGQLGVVSGWGRFQDSSQAISDFLRFVRLPIITNLTCRTRWPTLITEAHICADGANGGPCQGDSGGPLSVVEEDGQTTQVGVVSFGLGLGCELNWPSVYLRVTHYLQWIEDNTERTIEENWN